MKELYDVLVIGGGVVGSAVARELSRYRLRIGVLEKNLDVCNETSGRNSGVVHGGFAYDRGSLKAKLCVEGNRMMGDLAKELDFRFIRCGKVLVGNTDEDMETLKRTIRQGEDNGASGLELIDEKRLHELVPAVVGKFAMYSKNSGIVDPFGYTIALAENAHANGAEYHFGCEVTDISRDGDGNYCISTSGGTFYSRWVVNSAGLGCGKISDLHPSSWIWSRWSAAASMGSTIRLVTRWARNRLAPKSTRQDKRSTGRICRKTLKMLWLLLESRSTQSAPSGRTAQ